MTPEILSPVYPTKLGDNEAAGFSWIHSGNDAEVMVYSVKGSLVYCVDFQKMIMENDKKIMDELMHSIKF